MSDNGKSKRLVITAAIVVVLALGAGAALYSKYGDKLRRLAGDRSPRSGQVQAPPGSGETTPAVAKEPVARSLAELAPQINLIGGDGVVPESVKLVFTRRITSNPSSEVPAATALRIEPATPGKLRYEGPQTLTFTPDQPFAFGTAYTVALTALDIDGEVVSEGGAGEVSRSFETPAFELKRVSLASIDEKRRKVVEYELVFTGAVDPKRVGAHASWSAGKAVSKVDYRSGKSANEVIATLPAADVATAERVAFTLKAGMPAAHYGAKTNAAQNLDIEMFAGKEVTVRATKLKEGANGFYVHVICNDAARNDNAENTYQNRIYYYDSDGGNGMYLSDRCVLDEQSAAARIRFTPEVKYTLVPARGGFRLLGEFPSGELSLTIDAGVRSVDGGVLKAPLHETYNVPRRKPSVGFVAAGRYLPRAAWRSLGVKHLNVDKAALSVRLVPPENMVFWMSADNETADERNSNLVARQDLALGGKPDVQHTTQIDLGAMMPSPPKGVMELTIEELPSRQSRQKKRLIITDINLVAKRARGGRSLHVWALDLQSGAPMAGVSVRQIVRSGRAVAECTTTAAGACRLEWDPAAAVDPAAPFALVAQKDGDMTYLKFDELKTEISEQLVQGRPFSGGETPYRAAVYSDRGAYRPGETAHVAAVVRADGDLAPDAGLPVELQLFDPREKLVRKMPLTTDTAGLVTADLSFPSFANTGRYRVSLVVGTAQIGQYAFNVEDFVPERMKVDVTGVKAHLGAKEPATVDVAARYLFGGSAEGSRVELTCELWPGEFKPKENATFHYGVWYPDREEPKALALGSVTGQLDAEGKVQLTCPTPEQGGGFAGPARVQARAVVFEGESGRSTQNDATIPVHPEAFYIGLASGQKKLQKGDVLRYQGVVVDWDGKLAPDAVGEIELELVRLEAEYDWSWDEGDGSSNYRRHLRQASEGKAKVKVAGGRFEGEFTVANPASGYLVRAASGNARTDLSLEGQDNGYWWWYPSESSRDQTPRPFKPGWLDIAQGGGDAKVKVGGDVKMTFVAPFKGRVLLTAETDELIASEWRDVQAGPVEWSFRLERFHPNVYLSAFLVKDPHLESKESFMPDRAFGVRSVRVEPTAYAHELKVQTPGEIRPNSTLTVDLDLGPAVEEGAVVTVAAVDEGILSLTKFKTPDPIRALFEARALGVETFETIGWNVMLPGAGPASATGGDGSEEDKPVQLVKPVALWSGPVAVGKSGKVSVSFEVPQYRGELRVMAVSVDKQRIGSAAANVFVRDPLVLQTTLPRFLTEGDDVQIPVSVTNMSGKDQKVTIDVDAKSVEIDGDLAERPVEFKGNTKTTLTMAVGQTQTVVFRAQTVAPIGGVAFAVKATAGDIVSHEDLEVPIISAKPKSRELKRLELTDGDNDVLPQLVGWTPTTEKSSFWVTANPYADALQHLKHLIRYPYGCIEQTTSSTRPLLVIRDLLQQIEPGMAPSAVEDMVKKGVERVLSMQTPSGGFGYWPGDDHPTQWATAYATHMLIDAAKLNFPVPKERIDDAVSWLHSQITNTFRYVNDDDYSYYDLRHAAPYMHYVLALAGKGQKADMQKLLDKLAGGKAKDGETAEQMFMLKAGLYLAGDRRYEGDLKMPDISAVTPERRNSWSFYSDLRRRGMMLSTMADLFGPKVLEGAGGTLAGLIAETLRGHRSSWYSTQELVWSITGLGKAVVGGSQSFEAELVVNGKKPAPATASSWIVPRASEKKELRLKVKKADQGKVYLMLASEGVKVTPDPKDVKTGGDGLKLSRVYRRQDGAPLDPEADIKLGEVIFTELTIKNTSGDAIENVALVDRFPAAWEIENPRLGRGSAASFVEADALWSLSYMNIRDDRIEVFGSLKAYAEKKVYYASRAVVSGRFAIPPVEAEAMYDPRIWARENGGVTNVKGPWTEFAGQ